VNNRILQLLIILFSGLGLFASGVLSVAHQMGVTPPCGMAGGGCQRVQDDPSSSWFGIPVAHFGVAAYIVLLTLSLLTMFASSLPKRTLMRLGFLVSAVGAIISLGLQIYAFSVIKAQCDWCLGSAAAMCIIFVLHALLMQRSSSTEEDAKPRKKLDIGLVSVVLLGSILAIGPVSSLGVTGGQPVDTKRFGTDDPLSILTKGGHVLGPETAKITIVEFADLLCGACKNSFNHLKKLQTEYPGKIRWIFRIFPLYNVPGKELSLPSSVIAEHAGKKGKFFEFVGQMYETDHEALKSIEDIYKIARNVNLDRQELISLIQSEDSDELKSVIENINLAGRIGIEETPTFIVFLPGEKPMAMRQRDLMAKFEESSVKELLKSQ
jgi:protein-disulfide isomerase